MIAKHLIVENNLASKPSYPQILYKSCCLRSNVLLLPVHDHFYTTSFRASIITMCTCTCALLHSTAYAELQSLKLRFANACLRYNFYLGGGPQHKPLMKILLNTKLICNVYNRRRFGFSIQKAILEFWET